MLISLQQKDLKILRKVGQGENLTIGFSVFKVTNIQLQSRKLCLVVAPPLVQVITHPVRRERLQDLTMMTRRIWKHENLSRGCHDFISWKWCLGKECQRPTFWSRVWASFIVSTHFLSGRWIFTMTGRPDLIWYFIRTKTHNFNKKLNQT